MVKPMNNEQSFPTVAPWRERVENYLRENYHDTSLSIGKMAYASFVSERQLYRLIKEEMGQTPGEFVRAYRLEQAKRLLDAGQVSSVSELAIRVGYMRTEFFSKIFEKTYGYRPVTQIKSGYRRKGANTSSNIGITAAQTNIAAASLR